MPRRNNRKKDKYENLRYLTKKDLRAIRDLESARVRLDDTNTKRFNTEGGSGQSPNPHTPQTGRAAIAAKSARPEKCENLAELYARTHPKRGEIWYADLGDFDSSSVQRGVRPAVIVSADIPNEKSGVVTVVPLTSKMKKSWYPSHIQISDEDVETGRNRYVQNNSTGQNQGDETTQDGDEVGTASTHKKVLMPSQVLTEQLQTIDKQYLHKKIGKVTHLKMLEIEEGMRESLTL